MPDVFLSDVCLDAICNDFERLRGRLTQLPANILADLFYFMINREKEVNSDLTDFLSLYFDTSKIFKKEQQAVKSALTDLETFIKLLCLQQKRHELHAIFQIICDMEYTLHRVKRQRRDTSAIQKSEFLKSIIVTKYTEECRKNMCSPCHKDTLYKNGMLIGEFFFNAGMFFESATVLQQCLFISLTNNDIESLKQTLACLQKLLLAQSHYSMFNEAKATFETSTMIIKKLESSGLDMNLCRIYSAFANYSLLECRYNDALEWSVKSLKALNETVNDARTKVDVLRQAAKSCAVKREFQKAELLITEAVYLARDIYGSSSVKYADALLDYGYFLINRDCVQKAVTVYKQALDIRKSAFGRYNLLTAIAHEDLAYALYVQEYSRGNFVQARENSNEAIRIMTILLPEDHLQLASAKRVKALILEEIAIDSAGTPLEIDLLREAESLHLAALTLSTKVFGEVNVQTAKHYGNLGRLYQTMKKYQDAECMHLKAISIKEKLLGMYDYEVALSVGHLASLYNYDLHQYRKAEELHLRSIQIGRKLFGKEYSGLEYDYRGLLQVYSMEGNGDKFSEYSRILSQWKVLQDEKSRTFQEKLLPDSKYSRSLPQVLNDFFQMEWSRSTEATACTSQF